MSLGYQSTLRNASISSHKDWLDRFREATISRIIAANHASDSGDLGQEQMRLRQTYLGTAIGKMAPLGNAEDQESFMTASSRVHWSLMRFASLLAGHDEKAYGVTGG
jgi:hypothetical protein